MVLLIPEVAFVVLVVLGAIGVVSLILSFLLISEGPLYNPAQGFPALFQIHISHAVLSELSGILFFHTS